MGYQPERIDFSGSDVGNLQNIQGGRFLYEQRHRYLNRKCILILIDGQNCFQGGAGHGRTSAQDWPGRPGF